MARFIISGGKKLQGEVGVAGSKNAVLALLSASLLSNEKSTLTNVPQIKDVEVMIDLIKDLGAKVEYDKAAGRMIIDPQQLNKSVINKELSAKLRASVLLLAPVLHRMKQVELPSAGGDKIGVRTIEPHLAGFEALGIMVERNGRYKLAAEKLTGSRIVLEESSVTATENLLMAASRASGTTVIKLAAMEPHVQQLAQFLNKTGAKISGIGTPTYVVEGVPALHGAEIEIIPDSNEAAAWIILAAATHGHVKVTNLNPEYLDDLLLKLRLFGVNFSIGKDFVEVLEPIKPYQAVPKVQVGLYPKLASDDTPPLAVLATQAAGDTVIYEWMYEDRLGYAPQINKMGGKAEILDPHRVKIMGPSKLQGSRLLSTDIRMGMALVIAALVAEGQSEIDGVEHIDRGFENLEQRLSALGAEIKRL